MGTEGGSCSIPSSLNIAVKNSCSSLSPSLSAKGETTVVRGNDVNLSVAGCSSDIVWYRGTTHLSDEEGPTMVAKEAGIYKVICTVKTCPSRVSNTISISHFGTPSFVRYSPEDRKVHQNGPIYLLASGCNSYDWSAGVNPEGHQGRATGPGTYSVRCVSHDKTIYSD